MDDGVVCDCNHFVKRAQSQKSDDSGVFFVIKRPVAPVSNMPMASRAWSLMPSRCGMSCVLQYCVVETGSLNVTLWHMVERMGKVWPIGGDA